MGSHLPAPTGGAPPEPPVVTEPLKPLEPPEPPVVTEPLEPSEPAVVTEPPEPPVVTEPPEPPVVTKPPEPPVVTESPEPPVVTESLEPPVVFAPAGLLAAFRCEGCDGWLAVSPVRGTAEAIICDCKTVCINLKKKSKDKEA